MAHRSLQRRILRMRRVRFMRDNSRPALGALTGARVLAAIWVVLYHYFFAFQSPPRMATEAIPGTSLMNPLLLFFWQGHLAVDFFFYYPVLSWPTRIWRRMDRCAEANAPSGSRALLGFIRCTCSDCCSAWSRIWQVGAGSLGSERRVWPASC
jgi:hypothetical protein